MAQAAGVDPAAIVALLRSRQGEAPPQPGMGGPPEQGPMDALVDQAGGAGGPGAAPMGPGGAPGGMPGGDPVAMPVGAAFPSTNPQTFADFITQTLGQDRQQFADEQHSAIQQAAAMLGLTGDTGGGLTTGQPYGGMAPIEQGNDPYGAAQQQQMGGYQ